MMSYCWKLVEYLKTHKNEDCHAVKNYIIWYYYHDSILSSQTQLMTEWWQILPTQHSLTDRCLLKYWSLLTWYWKTASGKNIPLRFQSIKKCLSPMFRILTATNNKRRLHNFHIFGVIMGASMLKIPGWEFQRNPQWPRMADFKYGVNTDVNIGVSVTRGGNTLFEVMGIC